jgi:DNA polymerase III delta subunit
MLHILYGLDRGYAHHRARILAASRPLEPYASIEEALGAALTPAWEEKGRAVLAWDVSLDAHAATMLGGAAPHLLHPLIVWTARLDRRETGALSGAATFEAVDLKPAALVAAVAEAAAEEGVSLAPGAAAALRARGATFLDLLGEVRLASLLVPEGAPVPREALQAVAFPREPEAIFAFLDAVAARDAKTAFAELDVLLTQGEPPLRIASQLTRHWRRLTFLAAGVDLPADLGVHPYVRQKLERVIRLWRAEELRAGFRRLLELDARLKSGRSPAASLTACVVALLTSAKGA